MTSILCNSTKKQTRVILCNKRTQEKKQYSLSRKMIYNPFVQCSCRLEELVKKQNAELEELRQRGGSAHTTSTSGRGSLTPEGTQGSTPQVSNTPSSGRGTSFCHRGTDPLYEWPERPNTCTRSTSPLFCPDPSGSMTSPVESRENLTNQELGEENNDAPKQDLVRAEVR